MHAPPERVWAALTDPAVLVDAIPGCQRLEPAGPDAYRFTIAAGLAGTRGVYTGEVALADQRQPSSFRLIASGAGGPGTVRVSISIRLASAGDDSTELGYDADGVVAGIIAGVGHRLVAAVAQRMASEFFRSVDDHLARNVAEPGQSAPPGPADEQVVPDVYLPSPRAAAGRDREFVRGVLVGTAATLAGVALGKALGRKNA